MICGRKCQQLSPLIYLVLIVKIAEQVLNKITWEPPMKTDGFDETMGRMLMSSTMPPMSSVSGGSNRRLGLR